ncbi:MAG: hypothetical protein IJI66_13915 [Erysipelotrichaceae bacterium]|nr:hypothetical protein [Erysipelotrichaceae bacterium]
MELINKDVAYTIFNNLDQDVKDHITIMHLESDPEDHKLTAEEFYRYLETALESNVEYDTGISILQVADDIPEHVEHEKEFISLPVDEDTTLYAEKNNENGFLEMMVYIKKGDGSIQDLARAGQDFKPDERLDDIVGIPGLYYVVVYADENQEDWTNEFTIKEYKEEE